MAKGLFGKNHTIDMTEGKIARIIFQFGVPLMITNLLQQVYSLADGVILGRFSGVSALATLGTCSWPIWLQISVLGNFAQASSLMLGSRFGAGKTEEMKQATGNIYLMAIGLYLFLMPVLLLAIRPMLLWQNTPDEIMDDAVIYMQISYWGTLFLLMFNVFAGMLRAVGDSKTTLYAVCSATVINVVLDLWFVAGLGWGVAGAAIATVIAQSVSAIICAVKVSKYEMFRLHLRHFKLDRDVLSEYFSRSVPMMMQSFILAIGGFFVQKHINNYGANFAAGLSASEKIFIIIETSGIALSHSAASFVSQNYGAKKFDRIRLGVKTAVCISLCFAFLSASFVFLFGERILSQFVAPEAIKYAWGSLCVTGAGLFIMYPMYVVRQSLQALGNTIIPLVAAFVQLIMRVVAALVFPLFLGYKGLYFTTFAAWLTSLILICAVFPLQLKSEIEKGSFGRVNI